MPGPTGNAALGGQTRRVTVRTVSVMDGGAEMPRFHTLSGAARLVQHARPDPWLPGVLPWAGPCAGAAYPPVNRPASSAGRGDHPPVLTDWMALNGTVSAPTSSCTALPLADCCTPVAVPITVKGSAAALPPELPPITLTP